MVAFMALSAATIWGLLVSTRLPARWISSKSLTWTHESFAISSVVATLVHIGVLSIHDYVDFSWSEILIPGRSDWRPFAISLGVGAFYGLTLVTASFYLRRLIGQKTWRTLHYGSLGVFLAALVHGVTAGTDSTNPLFIGLYAGSALAVAALIGLRLTYGTLAGRPNSQNQISAARAQAAARPDA